MKKNWMIVLTTLLALAAVPASGCIFVSDDSGPDLDQDGIEDADDNCPSVANVDQFDVDLDGFGDQCDNCPNDTNIDQANGDGDALGNACDDDLDNDGVPNNLDNCPQTANTDQADDDDDGLGNACDTPSVTAAVFHATWTVSDPGGVATCAEVGADKTSFLFTQASNSMGFDEVFACQDLAGDTVPLPLDDYTWVAALLDCLDADPGCSNSTTLLMSDPQNETTDTCDQIVGNDCFIDLPTVDFIFR
jgi:hypothetical protein